MKTSRLFETHLNTANLERAVEFYQLLGFELASILEERRVAFFWIGETKEQMLGIWETKKEVIRQHTAFSITLDELKNSFKWLNERGIEAEESFGLAPTEPVVHCWMPSASVYFSDPDGNSLEYITALEGPSKPELGVLHLSEWEKLIQTTQV